MCTGHSVYVLGAFSCYFFLFFALVVFVVYISFIVRACRKCLGGKFALVERMKKQTDPIIVVMLLNVGLTLFVYRMLVVSILIFHLVFFFSLLHILFYAFLRHTQYEEIDQHHSSSCWIIVFQFGPFALHVKRLELVVYSFIEKLSL